MADLSQHSSAHYFLLHHTNTVVPAQQIQHISRSQLTSRLSQGLQGNRKGLGSEVGRMIVFLSPLFLIPIGNRQEF